MSQEAPENMDDPYISRNFHDFFREDFYNDAYPVTNEPFEDGGVGVTGTITLQERVRRLEMIQARMFERLDGHLRACDRRGNLHSGLLIGIVAVLATAILKSYLHLG